ncbi:MAG: methylase [Sphingobacteriaceae bacterium]|jgi:type I restriction enzyme M protein|nr:methylase [Sphingobacteriaceae bacterium]
MLDPQTKNRINDCRDILVGKLPDPKAQIEQITIALIYKFMDDMDKETIDLGGTAKFFSDDYEKFSWDNLFNTKVTAAEMLRLYSEALMSMDKNPNIPQLFRDIFKNAYLPYRDPETLKLFLKTIGGFEYTHSEKLGDAFEYLLSVMGSQGDAGQFRTPRHIIDFLVKIVNPGKNDKILDPACGTSGFLISAFKHIKEQNNDEFTPDERKRLLQNFTGYDISPDMVRLSLVNLYLHGFPSPHIYEYDTLSSEERWGETFDCILANPPFMSPKGGIRPHKKFSISSNRSEVLFVDYIAEHLNPKGKAGIIVPEGIIFQSGTAYKALRKMLVDNYLYAVVSLPAGIFNPYSGVKTSILLMDKELAKTRDEILFVKIDNDGFNLGTQRNAVKGSQLEEAVEIIHDFAVGGASLGSVAHKVARKEIGKSGDYNLSGERYKTATQRPSNFPLMEIGAVCELVNGRAFKPIDWENEEGGGLPIIRIQNLNNKGATFNYYSGEVDRRHIVQPGDLLFSWSGSRGTSFGAHIWFGKKAVLNQHIFNVYFDNKKANKKYLFHILNEAVNEVENNLHGGVGLVHITKGNLERIKIPVPSISVQEEIVAEIEGYQKILDGAKAVVENYKPKIDIDPSWEMVELGDVCESISDGDHQPPPKAENGVPFITISNIAPLEGIDFTNTFFVPRRYFEDIKSHRKPFNGDILYTVTGSYGIPVLIDFDLDFCFQRHIALIRPSKKVLSHYLFYYLQSPDALLQANRAATGMAQKTVSLNSLRRFTLPLPPVEIQTKIISRLRREQELVNANKQLIQIFEQKIKDRIAKVWGKEKEEEEEVLSMAAEGVVEYGRVGRSEIEEV